MSATKCFVVPDLNLYYRLGDAEMKIDPVEALIEIDRISRDREGCSDFEHLDDFAAWLESRSGVRVGRDAADFLIDSIRKEYLRMKREWRGESKPNPSQPAPNQESQLV